MKVSREMISAAHGVTMQKGKVILSADLLTRIYVAMKERQEADDTYSDGDVDDVLRSELDKARAEGKNGWDAYECLRAESDKMIIELQTELAASQARHIDLCVAVSRMGRNAEEFEFSDQLCVNIPIDDYNAVFDLLDEPNDHAVLDATVRDAKLELLRELQRKAGGRVEYSWFGDEIKALEAQGC